MTHGTLPPTSESTLGTLPASLPPVNIPPLEENPSNSHPLSGRDIAIIVGTVGGFLCAVLVTILVYLLCKCKKRRERENGFEVNSQSWSNRRPLRFDVVRPPPYTIGSDGRRDDDGRHDNDGYSNTPTLQIRGRPRAEMAMDPSLRNSHFSNPVFCDDDFVEINRVPYNWRMPADLQMGIPDYRANFHHQKSNSMPESTEMDRNRSSYVPECRIINGQMVSVV